MKRLLIPTIVFASLWGVSLAASGREAARADEHQTPTFSNEVVRIFQANCQTCHHPGDIGPFSLMRYDQAALWAPAIRAAVVSREMPPWKPEAGCGDFEGARRLTDAEIETIVRWADAGAPEGNPADMPEDLVFPDEWKMGQPDFELVISKKPFKFPGTSTEDLYRCFTVPANFDADRFITGVEIRPGNRAIVHHVLVFVDETGASVALDRADPGPGYTTSGGGIGFTPTASLGGWAPGAGGSTTPSNAGILVPKGARIVVQVHYSVQQLTGEDAYDQTKVGLHFAREPIYKDFYVLPLINTSFTIPAGADRHQVTAAFTLPSFVNVTLHQIAPHMHLLGREMRVRAISPEGEERCLINITDWDFHWQGTYRYVEPIPLRAGTRLELEAFYDNSAGNPSNPSTPPRDVSWGEGTRDEMCIAFLGVTVDAEARAVSSPAIVSARVAGNKLVVSGSDIGPGSIIEVDGAPIRDSKAKGRGSVASRADWQQAIPAGRGVSLTILNPDGARSAPVSFSR